MTGNIWERLRSEAASGNDGAEQFLQLFDEYNKSIGYALTELHEQPQDIQGRDAEIAMLHAVIERPKTPVALLLGHAGVGKTALVEEFAKQLNSGHYKTVLKHSYMLVALRIGNLASLGTSKLQSTLASLLDKLKDMENAVQAVLNDPTIRIVMFVDEVHMIVTIFGPGTKIGGDVIKDVLARSPIRVIAATTRREYDSTIAVDKPLAERFKQIEMRELEPKIVKQIARNWWQNVAPDCVYPSETVIDRMIEANKMYRSDSAEPRKSLDILEDLVSYSRRTGIRADIRELARVFRDRYSISLEFKVDADQVYAEIESRVKGQPHALYTMKRLLRTMVFQLDPTSNKPQMTALFTGPTGVGKALPDNTPILTPTGFTTMREIKVGDKVINRLGKPVTVTGVYPQGYRPVYKLGFDDGSCLSVDIDHINVFTTGAGKTTLDTSKHVNITTREILKIDIDKTNLYLPSSARPRLERFLKASNMFIQHDINEIIACGHRATENIARMKHYKPEYIRKLFASMWRRNASALKHLLDEQLQNKTIKTSMHWRSLYLTPDKTFAEFILKLGAIAGEHIVLRTVYVGRLEHYLVLHNPKHDKRSPRARLTSVTYVAKMPCTCIKVNDPEHCFIAGNHLIVTHNTETVKCVADTLYPGEPVMLNINMPDYKTAEHEPAFRKRVGEFIRHVPNAIILLDEFEKAHESVRDSMLTILDEGLITFEVVNREGVPEVNTVSLRNSIVFATTNAGSEVFANDAKFSQREALGQDSLSDVSRAEIESLHKALLKYLEAAGFKPEMLGRFNRIIPYRSLASGTLLTIAERALDEIADKFKLVRGVDIVYDPPRQWPQDVYNYYTTDVALYIAFIRAKADDPNSGGARAIKREIMSTVFDSIVDAIIDNPKTTRFRVYVSKHSAIYNYGAANSEGGIIVEPLP